MTDQDHVNTTKYDTNSTLEKQKSALEKVIEEINKPVVEEIKETKEVKKVIKVEKSKVEETRKLLLNKNLKIKLLVIKHQIRKIQPIRTKENQIIKIHQVRNQPRVIIAKHQVTKIKTTILLKKEQKTTQIKRRVQLIRKKVQTLRVRKIIKRKPLRERNLNGFLNNNLLKY